uniref:Uncharacterized protein LOC114344191 n=1 Tax=Diabrotica virgifera virgifera TaxID=50390 RepID=A0A6P7GLQ7_DIAVI
METKQEAGGIENTCSKIKTDNENYDGPLDVFKMEIKEEPKTESEYDNFDYLDSKNVVFLKTEVEQDEHKFTPFEENQTTNEENRFDRYVFTRFNTENLRTI